MPEKLEAWQRQEVHHELLPALVASDCPRTEEDEEQSKRYWLAQGYESMVDSVKYLNQQKRRARR